MRCLYRNRPRELLAGCQFLRPPEGREAETREARRQDQRNKGHVQLAKAAATRRTVERETGHHATENGRQPGSPATPIGRQNEQPKQVFAHEKRVDEAWAFLVYALGGNPGHRLRLPLLL